jgi:hypothetical protein
MSVVQFVVKIIKYINYKVVCGDNIIYLLLWLKDV